MSQETLKDALDNDENLSEAFKAKLIPEGGATGQALRKQSEADHDADWENDPDLSEVYAAKEHDHDSDYLQSEDDPVAMEAIGTMQHTEKNVVSDENTITQNIDALDMAIGTIDQALAEIIGEEL